MSVNESDVIEYLKQRLAKIGIRTGSQETMESLISILKNDVIFVRQGHTITVSIWRGCFDDVKHLPKGMEIRVSDKD